MRPICVWRQRQLSRLLVTGEPVLPDSFLARHLAHCPDCAQAHRDLAHLQGEVSRALPGASLSSGFEATLQTRLRMAMATAPRRRSFPALTEVWNFLAVGLIALVLIGYGTRAKLSSGESARPVASTIVVVANPIVPSPIHQPLLSVRQEDRQEDRQEGRQEGIKARARTVQEARRGPHRQIAAISRRRRHREEWQRPQTPQSDGLVVEVEVAVSNWQEVGDVYATYGDHASACRAYTRAFAENPDIDLALAASDSAAQTGDLSESLIYYARILETSNTGDPTPATVEHAK